VVDDVAPASMEPTEWRDRADGAIIRGACVVRTFDGSAVKQVTGESEPVKSMSNAAITEQWFRVVIRIVDVG
jgi:hypothetical protein